MRAQRARRNALNLPASTALLACHHVRSGLSRNTTGMVVTAGTTNPTITITGTTDRRYDFRIRIPTGGGGVRGVATFEWSSDGTTYSSALSTSSSPVALGSTGASANFSPGTYTAGDAWRQTFNSWLDRRAGSLDFAELVGSGNQPAIRYSGIGGFPCLEFDGTLDRLRCADSTFATAIAGGNDKGFAVAMVAQVLGVDGSGDNHPLWAVSNEITDTSVAWFGIDQTGTQWLVNKRPASGSAVTTFGGTADYLPHRFIFNHSGTNAQLFVDGTSVINASSDVGSLTLSVVTVGGLLSIANRYANCLIGEVNHYNRSLSADEIAYIDRNLKNAWLL